MPKKGILKKNGSAWTRKSAWRFARWSTHPRPAEYRISTLTLSPPVPMPNEPVCITADLELAACSLTTSSATKHPRVLRLIQVLMGHAKLETTDLHGHARSRRTPSTQFFIGSITKTFTATAVALLNEEHCLDWTQ